MSASADEVSLPTEAAAAAGAAEPPPPPPTEAEVAAIIQSVRDATSTPPAGEYDLDSLARASDYWDAATMAPLNARSVAAIARLRAYKPPPFPVWDKLPASRRAAVLLLLYADRRGDLRVVITMRAASLRSFSGHAALPGGKADSVEETPYQIARREAWEEIGLPMDDSKIPAPFRIEHLCSLPCTLARSDLVVRPCVALLHAAPPTAAAGGDHPPPTVEGSLMPRLDAKEVAAVFSAPFHNFLRAADEVTPPARREDLPPGPWYEGSWTHFHRGPWRVHNFYVPVTAQRVTKPRQHEEEGGGGAAPATEGQRHLARVAARLGEQEDEAGRYKVWGMTGRILVDTARVAYGEEPEFEHNGHFGDEAIIDRLHEKGGLGEKKKPAEAAAAAAGGDAAAETSKM